MAQTPGVTAPGAAPGGAGAAGATTPAANSPSPGVGSGTSPLVPGRPLTLADVVNIAVGGNSGLVLARQRLQKAQELINQVNAQNRPQLSAAANDTYSSYPAFPPTLVSPTISNPTLPGGGQIPTVVDQAGGLSTAFVGGGGGNAPSTGSTPGIGGTTTSGVGTSPNVGSSSPAGPSTPAVGGTSPTVGGSSPTGGTTGNVTTPGTSAPGSASPSAAGSAGAAPGGTTPNTGAGAAASPTSAPSVGGAAPSNGAGTTGGGAAVPGTGTGAGGAAGMALLTLPAIIGAYVADMHTLTQPPSPEVIVPHISVSHDTGTQAEPRAAGDAGGGTSGTGASTSGSGGSALGASGGAQGLRDTYAARASAAQYIDLFGLLPAARGAQHDVRDFYALDITRLQNETALAAKNLFFNVLLAQAQVATEQEQVAYAQENVRITEARLQQGIVSRFDVLTAQTALATAQQQFIAAQDQYDLAQSNISYLLGTDPDQAVVLVTPPLPPLDQPIDLPQSTRIALRQRPEVGQSKVNINEAQQLIKSAGSTLLPTLGVVGSGYYTSNGSVTTPRSYATISAEVAVPLDDGGATRSRVRSARIDLATQALTLEQLKLTVALEVRQATVNVRNAQAQVGAAATALAQSQEAVRLAYVRYQGGLGTFLDVLNALAQLATTRTNLANAQFFYQTSLAQLVRALGGR